MCHHLIVLNIIKDIEIAQENQENSPLLDLDPFTQLSNQSQAIQLNDTEDDPFLDIALRSNRPTQGKIVIPSTLPNTQTRQNFSLPTDNYSAPVQYPSAPFYPESSTESPAFAQPDVISTPVSYTSPQEQSSYSPSMSISSTNIPTSDPFPQMLITGPVNTAPADVSFESSTENRKDAFFLNSYFNFLSFFYSFGETMPYSTYLPHSSALSCNFSKPRPSTSKYRSN